LQRRPAGKRQIAHTGSAALRAARNGEMRRGLVYLRQRVLR